MNFHTAKEPTTGFMVALKGHTGITSVEDFKAHAVARVADYLKANAEALSGKWVGGWLDTEHNEFVFDVSVNVDTEDEAVKLGRANDQQAVWDVVNQREIPCGGTGQRDEASAHLADTSPTVHYWQMPDLTKMSDDQITALAQKMAADILGSK